MYFGETVESHVHGRVTMIVATVCVAVVDDRSAACDKVWAVEGAVMRILCIEAGVGCIIQNV